MDQQPQILHRLLPEQAPNCGDDALHAFISGLQVFHPLYNDLLKHNITRVSGLLSRAQPYIQLEEALKTSSYHSVKPGDHGGKLKSPHEASTHAQDQNWRQLDYNRQAFLILSPSLLILLRACSEPTGRQSNSLCSDSLSTKSSILLRINFGSGV